MPIQFLNLNLISHSLKLVSHCLKVVRKWCRKQLEIGSLSGKSANVVREDDDAQKCVWLRSIC